MRATESKRNSLFSLAFVFLGARLRRMDTKTAAADIEERAYQARVSVNELLKRAGVSTTAVWRWKTGDSAQARPVTLGKVIDALEAIEREKAA